MSVSHESTTTGTWVRSLYHVLDSRLAGTDKIFGQYGLNPDDIKAAKHRVDVNIIAKIWEEAEQKLEDDAIGLYVAQHFVDYASDALKLAGMSSIKMHDALERLEKFYPTVTTGIDLHISYQAHFTKFEIAPSLHASSVSQYGMDGAVAAVLASARALTGDPIENTEVYLMRQQPKNIEAFQDFFKGTIHFNQATNGISFHRDYLNFPLQQGNPSLAQHLDQLLSESLKAINSPEFSKSVYQRMKRIDGANSTRIAFIANEMAMSERTLQRKLANEGVCFNDLITAVKLQKAKALLLNENLPHAAISDQLGFSSHSNFIRFFRKHTGITPKSFVTVHLNNA